MKLWEKREKCEQRGDEGSPTYVYLYPMPERSEDDKFVTNWWRPLLFTRTGRLFLKFIRPVVGSRVLRLN